jgi:hypothetical protein
MKALRAAAEDTPESEADRRVGLYGKKGYQRIHAISDPDG